MKLLLSTAFLLLFVAQAFSQSKSTDSYMKLDSINSTFLGEYRKVITYFPENYHAEKSYPIIYATDGQIILDSDYKSLLDSLISEKKIPPVILIGVYSNETEVGQNVTLRNYEYVKSTRGQGKYGDRYDKHLNFFLYELNDYLANNLKVQQDITQRIFYGCSNGGGYGISLLIDNSNRFSAFICFSPVGVSYDGLKRKKKDDTKVIISYGDKENFIFINAFEELHQNLTKKKIKHDYYAYSGGHERILWKKEFERNLITLLGEKGSVNED